MYIQYTHRAALVETVADLDAEANLERKGTRFLPLSIYLSELFLMSHDFQQCKQRMEQQIDDFALGNGLLRPHSFWC